MSEIFDQVTGVHIFPIKSCHEATIDGQLPTELTVGKTGFVHESVPDRGWVIRDEDALFVSQRGWDENQALKHKTDRILATVTVDIQPEHLVVSSLKHGELKVPITTRLRRGPSVRIFGPLMPALDAGKEPAAFFSDLLGRSVRLMRNDPKRPRWLPEKYQEPEAANQSAGADGRPFSLASQASLDYLHEINGYEVGTMPLNRYRANIEIDGKYIGPLGEDLVKLWRIGKMLAHDTKALERCPMPNFDQDTGVDDQLSTKLLRATRMGWAVGDDRSARPKPYFAQSLNHLVPSRVPIAVKVGDIVRVLLSGDSNFIPKD